MILDETFMPFGTRPSPASDAATLQVGAIQTRSHVAGPGVRSVVWVAGCHRRCPGCLKPDLFDFRAGERTGDLRHFNRMGQARAVMVAFMGDEDLRLMRQTPERGRMDDPVAVTLISAPCWRRRFAKLPAARAGRITRICGAPAIKPSVHDPPSG